MMEVNPTGINIASAEQLENYFSRGEELYQESKYEEAKQLFEKAANLNHSQAQYMIGICYYLGKGEERDEETAMEWFQKAALQNNAFAKYMQEEHKYRFPNTKIDYIGQAISSYYYARRSCVNSQFAMGNHFASGAGVSKNEQEALKWFKIAAERGDREALYVVGLYYKNGTGVEQDMQLALHYFKKSALQYYGQAQYELGLYYKSQIAEHGRTATLQAIEWFSRACMWPVRIACYELAWLYYYKQNGVQDYSEAFRLLHGILKDNYPPALHLLAECYQWGNGTEKNEEKAAELYVKAIDCGNAESLQSLYLLAKRFESGHGVDRNKQYAVALYKQASDRGSIEATVALADCYERGCGVTCDLYASFSYYLKAAVNENTKSQIIVGDFYRRGGVIPQNRVVAKQWYMRAVKLGDASAQDKIDSIALEDTLNKQHEFNTRYNFIREAYEKGNIELNILSQMIDFCIHYEMDGNILFKRKEEKLEAFFMLWSAIKRYLKEMQVSNIDDLCIYTLMATLEKFGFKKIEIPEIVHTWETERVQSYCELTISEWEKPYTREEVIDSGKWSELLAKHITQLHPEGFCEVEFSKMLKDDEEIKYEDDMFDDEIEPTSYVSVLSAWCYFIECMTFFKQMAEKVIDFANYVKRAEVQNGQQHPEASST